MSSANEHPLASKTKEVSIQVSEDVAEALMQAQPELGTTPATTALAKL